MLTMQTADSLQKKFDRLEGRGYKSYKSIKGSYSFSDFTLYIDHVQGDPFAAPSRFRVEVSQRVAQFPNNLTQNKIRRIALADYLIRQFDRAARRQSKNRGSGKSGRIEIDTPGQEVLERTAATIHPDVIELRFFVGLPARGRIILGHQAIEMIHESIPTMIDRTLKFQNLNQSTLQSFVETVEDAEALRNQLQNQQLLAFVANGALLPRKSGIDPRPLPAGAIPFQSPLAFEVMLERPNAGRIVGMGIPLGVTLIVGGGYHGKSTLLRAIEGGVYNHIPGDGREFVVTDPDAVKIRAEDGRGVSGVDISPFISNLPQGRPTTSFSSENASGSTSQAANIMEALEIGARALLIDEDTAATNFMIRDHRMQELIAKAQEPITPFIDKVRPLFTDHGVSSILVIGGSGDYFERADRVIAMTHYQASDVTHQAQEIAQKYAGERKSEGGERFGRISRRIPIAESLDPSRDARNVYLKVHDVETITFGTGEIDLSAVEQLVAKSQVRAITHALLYAKQRYMDGKRPLSEVIDRIMADIEQEGLDVLTQAPYGNLAAFRRFEWTAALNRLRILKIRPSEAP